MECFMGNKMKKEYQVKDTNIDKDTAVSYFSFCNACIKLN